MSAESADPNGHGAGHVLKTPLWMTVIRGFQILITLIIVGLAGTLIHQAYLDEEGLALAVSLITWVIVAYIVITEKIPSLHKAYHIIAVLSLDGFLVIMWLATFAAAAAERARYVEPIQVDECYSDGSLIDSMTCFRKREVILFKSGAAMFAAIAGLGALVWLLFVATFAWTMTMFFRGRKEGRFMFGAKSDDHQMENQQPFVQQQVVQPEKTEPHQQQQPTQPPAPGVYQPMSPPGQYQVPPAGQYPPQGQYPQPGYQPPVSPSPVSQYHSSSPPPQELHGQQPQVYQNNQYPGYQGQQPVYPQNTGSVASPQSELDAQQHPASPPQELYGQQPQPYPNNQYPPHDGHQGQQPVYPQSELDAQQHPASPPPAGWSAPHHQ